MLNGKVAVVTGGSKGIGFAIAESLLRAGAKVMICGRGREDLKTAAEFLAKSGHVETEVCDLRSEDQVRQLLEQTERLFGGVDILVNNAGFGITNRSVEDTSGDEFRQIMETNLNGVFYMCHYGVPMLKKRDGGYIINISSLAGQNPHANMATYNASKFALNGFSEALMMEVRQDNIKLTTICPGSVNTDFAGGKANEARAWQIQPEDIGQIVIDLLEMDDRALPSKIELRPSKPPQK